MFLLLSFGCVVSVGVLRLGIEPPCRSLKPKLTHVSSSSEDISIAKLLKSTVGGAILAPDFLNGLDDFFGRPLRFFGGGLGSGSSSGSESFISTSETCSTGGFFGALKGRKLSRWESWDAGRVGILKTYEKVPGSFVLGSWQG